jgi:8-oxo-dGTP diphosphatase
LSEARALIASMDRLVVGALLSDGRVLLVHRRPDKRARPCLWDLPGGVIETGESELGALARELHEELGVQVSTGSASHLGRVSAGPAGEPALLNAWLVREWQGTPANVAPEEHDQIAWFGLADLPPHPHVVVRTALVNAMRSSAG